MPNEVFLILHGWGGNKPDHWQEHLVNRLHNEGRYVFYPRMPAPELPELSVWQNRLHAELLNIAQEAPEAIVTVLAHSLGSINWMHYAAAPATASLPVADRVLLVAPPYILPQIPPVDTPPTLAPFFPPPMSPEGIRRVARETVLVASDTDDYATFDQSGGYAKQLDIPIHLLKGAGHISPYYGYGEWPWVYDWAMRRSSLPPQPRPSV